tara:strand:- start:297 stop:521 length:225 start_codon:yes stop_codon:yes gene_type:complete
MKLSKLNAMIYSIYNNTEMDIDDLSKLGLKKNIKAISSKVESILKEIQNLKSCTICSYEVCDECDDEMAKQYGE